MDFGIFNCVFRKIAIFENEKHVQIVHEKLNI